MLVLAGLPAGAMAASQDPIEVQIPEHRGGDIIGTHAEETWVRPSNGRIVRSHQVEDLRSTYSVRETGLTWNDTHRILHVNVRDVSSDEFQFEQPYALDLTTGERVLQWAGFAVAFQFVGSFGLLGVVEQETEGEGNLTFVEFTSAPNVRLQQIVGDAVLTEDTNLTTVIDHRPRFDRVERYHLNVTGTDTVGDRETLVANLTAEVQRNGSWEDVGLPAKLWLADGLPVPVKTVIDIGQPPLAYRLERTLVSYERGQTPIPWGQGEPPRRDGPSTPYERSPLDREGPADGSASEAALPLSEAVFLAKTMPTAADFQAWLLQNPDAALVAGTQEADPTPEGHLHRWTLTFADGDEAERVVVERRFVEGAPERAHVDTVEDASAPFDPPNIDPTLFDGQPALTIGQLLAFEENYARAIHDERIYGFSFFENDGTLEGQLWIDTFRDERETGPAMGLLDANTSRTGRVTVFDAFDGQALLRIPYETNATLRTHIRPPATPSLGGQAGLSPPAS